MGNVSKLPNRGRLGREVPEWSRRLVSVVEKVTGKTLGSDSGVYKEFAKIVGIHPEQISRYCRGIQKNPPHVDTLQPIQEKTGYSIQWVLTGIPPERIPRGRVEQPPVVSSPTPERLPVFDLIPNQVLRLDPAVATDFVDAGILTTLNARRSANVVAVRLQDNVMAPTVMQGDLAFIDLNDIDPDQDSQSSGFYLVEVNGLCLGIRRICPIDALRYYVYSDNALEAEGKVLGSNSHESWQFLGRVLEVHRTFV